MRFDTVRASFLAFFVFCGSQGWAQQLQVGISSGYALPFMGDNIGLSATTNDSGFTTESVIFGTYGRGVPVELDVAFRKGSLGFHLGLNYLLGTWFVVEGDYGDFYNYDLQARGRQLLLQPGVSLHGAGERLRPFATVGVSLPLTTNLYQDILATVMVAGQPQITTTQQSTIQGNFSVGFFSKMGVELQLGDHLLLNAGLHLTAQRIKGTRGEFTLLTLDGTDLIPGMNAIDREWEYVEVYSSESNGHPDNPDTDINAPAQVLQQSWNMSRASLMLGISYQFGN